jgi:hypothetical protein
MVGSRTIRLEYQRAPDLCHEPASARSYRKRPGQPDPASRSAATARREGAADDVRRRLHQTHRYVKEQHMPHVTLAGDRTGEYLVAEERPDGSLLLPDASAEAILDHMGARPASLEDFEAEHGRLGAPDGEGRRQHDSRPACPRARRVRRHRGQR